jgi:hypothetical protein
MSGILLPGQGSKPQGEEQSQGLILPSSAARKREEPAPAPGAGEQSPGQPEGEAGAPEQQAATGGAPRRGRRQASAADFLFPPQGAQVQCPNCGTPFVVPIFSIVDLGANPELKQPLLGGQINAALCPSCGAGGPLAAPLMVHIPEKQFLGVLIPSEARVSEAQRQKLIGDLTQALMRKLPQEQRKGYMLQPRQYMDWQRFNEQLWEFEGVTAEMLRRQRTQTDLLYSLINLADDRKALEVAIARAGDLIDRQFFSLLDRMMVLVSSQGQREEADRFVALREALLELTPAGKEVAAQQERIRSVLMAIKPETTREQLLQQMVELYAEPDGRELVGAVVMGLPSLFDYQFLMALSQRLDTSTEEAEKANLEQLREMVLTVQEQLQANRQAAAQQAQQLLQDVLSAEDTEAALRANLDLVDELFLGVLASSIQQAERNNSTGAARRLRQVYDIALGLLQEGLPPDMQLMNRLLVVSDAGSKQELNALLEENRAMLTPDFVESLRRVEAEMRETGRTDLADRVKSIRGQVALKM